MKKNRFGLVCILSVASVLAMSLTYLSLTARAEGAVNVNLIKQNVFYKAVYANLEKCYSNMKPTMEETEENVQSDYNSEAYFEKSALNDDFLKFPFNPNGGKEKSSCPGMIIGWHDSWLKNLFTGAGSFDGLLWINEDAKVPETDFRATESVDKMGEFLTNIGYEKTYSSSSVGDRKCFYLKGTVSDNAIGHYMSYLEPVKGWTMESPDYCVQLGGNDMLDPGEDILVLHGRNSYMSYDYDDGHLTDESNLMWPMIYTSSYGPEWVMTAYDSSESDSNGYVLTAPLHEVKFLYIYDRGELGQDTFATEVGVWHPDEDDISGNAQENCFAHGYVYCGWHDAFGWNNPIYLGLTGKNDSISYETLKSRMVNLLNSARIKDYKTEYVFSSVSAVDYQPQKITYKKGSSNAKYLNYFLNNVDKFNYGSFDNKEKYILYWTYLKEHYNVSTYDSQKPNSILVSWLKDDGTFAKKYIIDPDENLQDKRYVLFNTKWDGVSSQDWKWIANELAAIDVEAAFSTDVDPILTPDPPEDPEDPGTPTETKPNCYSNSGALGWILCPIIEQGADFVEDIYEGFIEPFLVLDSGLFDTGKSGGRETYKAWTQFQTYANILFVAGFLFVIFSQLTGIGIDNYGIKKILPKLVVGAILINLSYLICQLAIDVANIIGYGLKSIFDGIGYVELDKVALAEAPSNTIHTLKAVGTTSILVVLVALLAAPAVLAEGAGLLVPIFLAIIGIVIALFALFCILSLRKALAVVLVVISPLAFVCYMLPNTKKLFDKWLGFFKGILLSFPICSAMVYGGHAASRIIVAASDSAKMPSLLALSAAIMAVAPIFLIPGVIKKAMGSISSMVTSLSNKLSTGAKGRAMKYSRGLNYLKQRGNQNMQARQNEFNSKQAAKTLYGGRFSKGKGGLANTATKRNLRAGERKRYNAALGMVAAEDQSQVSAQTSMFKSLGSDDKIKEMVAQAADKGTLDGNMLSAAISAVHDENKIADIMQAAETKGAIQKIIGGNDPKSIAERQKIGNALTGRNGNVVAQSMGKIVAKDGMSYSEMLEPQKDKDGKPTLSKLAAKVQGAGTSVMAGQNKDVFEGGYAEGLFSTEQLAAGVGAGYSGDTADNFNRFLSQLGDGQKAAVLGSMTKGEQWANSSVESLNALGLKSGDDVDAFRANASDAVKQAISNFANSPDLHANADAGVMSMLGIDPTQTREQAQQAQNQALADAVSSAVSQIQIQHNDNTQAMADAVAGAVSSAMKEAQTEHDLDSHWASLSNEDKSKIFYNNPQKAGEDNKDYMNRVISEYKEQQAKKMRQDGGHFD